MQSPWSWSTWIRGRIPPQLQRWGREQYIPISPSNLVSKLVSQSAEGSIADTDETSVGIRPSRFDEDFRAFGEKLVELVHRQFRRHHQRLVLLYDEFDPDIDNRMLPSKELTETELAARESNCRNLFSEIAATLEHANYRRLTPREIQEAFSAASHWGVRLKIRFSSFRRLEVYGRGDIFAKRQKRNWRKWFRIEEVDVQIYQRVVVVFRTKEEQSLPELLDPDCVHVRMFKNIPKADVDMMLPGSQVRLTWADRGKIGIPTVWGLFMLASKIVKSFWLLALLGALKILSSFALVFAVAVAAIVYSVKSTLSYSTTKRRYQLNVARNLYYQNLDNNLGALLRLRDESEQQEACEAILAYYVLLRSGTESMSTQEIDAEAELILKSIVGDDVDYDVKDALRDLTAAGIIHPVETGWSPISLRQSLTKLTKVD
ncbi:MAG: DUF3754 domain-containing protein [Pirellula sp.]